MVNKDSNGNVKGHRPVRSFVRREGRLTPGQERAFETLWPRWGLDFQPAPLALSAIFGNAHPVYLEIGFGNGATLVQQAAQIDVRVGVPGIQP
mgnify:CR=1 FL=1